MDPTNNILSDIRERMVRVETKIDTMTDVQIKADNAESKAIEALTSTRSAHKRIDKIDKALFWVVTTVIGAVIIGIMALLIKGGN